MAEQEHRKTDDEDGHHDDVPMPEQECGNAAGDDGQGGDVLASEQECGNTGDGPILGDAYVMIPALRHGITHGGEAEEKGEAHVETSGNENSGLHMLSELATAGGPSRRRRLGGHAVYTGEDADMYKDDTHPDEDWTPRDKNRDVVPNKRRRREQSVSPSAQASLTAPQATGHHVHSLTWHMRTIQ